MQIQLNGGYKAMNIKITKRTLLKEINNTMCHNYYYLVQGRLYNDDNTRLRRFTFVVWFDAFDIQEFFDKDHYTKNDIREYCNECAGYYLDMIVSYNDCKEFYRECKQTMQIQLNGG